MQSDCISSDIVGSHKILDQYQNTVQVLTESIHSLQYFLGYKTDFFSFQNNPKDLDPSKQSQRSRSVL